MSLGPEGSTLTATLNKSATTVALLFRRHILRLLQKPSYSDVAMLVA